MRIIAIVLNVALLAFTGVLAATEGGLNSGELLMVIFLIATSIASLISLVDARPFASLVTNGPATWLSLWFKRKIAEERLRLRDIELAQSGGGHADKEAHSE